MKIRNKKTVESKYLLIWIKCHCLVKANFINIMKKKSGIYYDDSNITCRSHSTKFNIKAYSVI